MVLETIDIDYAKITYESIWFDAEKRLIRRDYKEASGNDPDPSTEIFDFNLGIHYSIDPYMGNCDPVSSLNLGDLFVVYNGNSTIRMTSALEYFHVANAQIQYVGTRVTRGVTCDVWVGQYLDDEANRDFTIEWYFTTDHWLEAVGSIIQPASLFRFDIWMGGSDKPVVRNVLQMNTEPPLQEVFNVAQCFPVPHKTRLLFHFTVVNNGSLDTVSTSYLKDTLHISLVKAAFLPPLRISGVSIEFVGTADVYVDAILLDNAPLVNPKIVPPPPVQHSLHAAFEFLQGVIGGRLKLSVNSTTVRIPVILEGRGVLQIDYKKEFTTTQSTTTTTTTEATPPIPQEPTTTKPLIPTKIRTPVTLPTTPKPTPCICPTTTHCPATKTIVITPSSCPTQQTTTQMQCATAATCKSHPPCPKLTCPSPQTPKVCPSITQLLQTKCPTTSVQTKCPTMRPLITTKCPTAAPSTPCPTVANPGSTSQIKSNKDRSPQSSGVKGGVVAAIALAMVAIGVVGGIVLRIVYIRFRKGNQEQRNILDKYLNDDDKY